MVRTHTQLRTALAWHLRNGKTQAEIAEACGVQQPMISKYLQGKTIGSGDFVLKLAACLGLHLTPRKGDAKC